MTFQVTALYASILAIAAIVLSTIVSIKRGQAGVSILHGDNLELALWIRKHGNFVEAVPFALLLMAFAEARGMPVGWLHGLGIVLLAARASHVVGLNLENPAGALRVAGGVGTQLCMLGAVAYLLWSIF